MNLFCKKYSVCKECKVHFDPAPSERHAELCPAHRKPVVELEDRILLVVEWAKRNWEKLEPDALKEEAERRKNIATYCAAAYSQQMAMPSRSGVGDLMGVFGL